MNEEANKMRKQEITSQNIFYCIAVVIIHLLSEPLVMLSESTVEYNILFCVQRTLFSAIYGFIFISAQKTFISDKYSGWMSYYGKRIKTVAWPYIIAVLVYWLVLDKTLNVKLLVRYILNGEIAAQFYFVIVIVQFYILVPVMRKFLYTKKNTLILVLSLFINMISVIVFYRYDFYNRIFLRYLFCYILGAFAGIYYDKFVDFIKTHRIKIFFVYPFVLAAEITSAYMLNAGKMLLLFQQLITTLYMPCAVIFWYSLFVIISEKHGVSVAKHLDRSTYPIYLWHVLILMLSDNILSEHGIYNVWSRLGIKSVVMLLFVSVIIILKNLKIKRL